MRKLALLIPELLPVTPDLGQAAFPVPVTPSLARILARASVAVDPPLRDGERLRLKLFGIELAATTPPPLAAIMRLDHGAAPDSNWWVRLDAVNLQADIDKLVLQPPGAMPLSAEANRTFGSLLREVLACPQEDLQPSPGGGWYLRLARDPEITTLPPLAGRATAKLDVLPAGKGAARWHQAITEMQMLLYQLGNDAATDPSALQGVNSVWVWGAGRCPERCKMPPALVFGEGALLQGLGRLSGAEVRAAPGGLDELLTDAVEAESILLVVEPPLGETAVSDPWAWQQWLQQMEAAWFEPIWRMLRRGQIKELRVYPGMGAEFFTTRKALHKFWRRSCPVTEWPRRLVEHVS